MGAYYVEHQIKLQGNSVLFLKHDVIVVLALCASKRCLMMCVSVDNKLIVCDVGVDCMHWITAWEISLGSCGGSKKSLSLWLTQGPTIGSQSQSSESESELLESESDSQSLSESESELLESESDSESLMWYHCGFIPESLSAFSSALIVFAIFAKFCCRTICNCCRHASFK